MKLFKKLTAAVVLICMLIPALTSCGLIELVPDFLLPDDSLSYHELQNTVSVLISDGEHYTVTSANPIKVERGADATFTVEIEEGYEYNPDTEGATYADGTLTVPSVKYPTTVNVLTMKKKVVIDIGGDLGPGTDPEPAPEEIFQASPVPEPTPLVPAPKPPPEMEIVVLEAEPINGQRFLCWTYGKPLNTGGTIFSTETSGVFEIPIGEATYSNYVSEDHYALIYRTNGGMTENGNNYHYQTFSKLSYYMPNTVHQNGTFKRDGYILTRYTTNANGTGDYTTLGGKISPTENGLIELYCQWEKVTETNNFTFELVDTSVSSMTKATYNTSTPIKYSENAVSITSYNGNAAKVVIPETITIGSGDSAKKYTVQHIAANAFAEKSITTLVLPSTIVKVDNNAFKNCTSLKTLTLHDNYTEILDGAFAGCTALETVYLNAGRLPWHSGEAQFARKYEKIVKAYNEGKKKIVVMSGSSSLYGLIAEEAEKEFGGEYSFVNFGTNAGVSICLYMEATTRYYTEGDIIVQAPETTSDTQYGATALTYLAFRGCEVMLNIFSNIDMRNYTGFFSGLSNFNQTKRNNSAGTSYDRAPSFINHHTDMMTNNNGGTWSSTENANLFNVGNLTEARMKMMKKIHDGIRARGAVIYLSFAPVNASYASALSKTEANQTAFVNAFKEKLGVTVISKPADYLFDISYFNNSHYHLGVPGARIRTERLVRDIKAQMALDGIPVPDPIPDPEAG